MTFTTRLTGRWALRGCGAPAGVLDAPWREVEYVVVDVETTGLDLRRDDIVSYGAVVVRSGRIVGKSTRYGLVRPTCPVSPPSVAVHTLRGVDLAGAPEVGECAEAMVELLEGRILVAHAAWVEEAFLGRALRTRGRKVGGPVLDTAALARGLGVVKAGSTREPSLEGLAMRLGLPVHTPHHALGDALTTAELLLAFAASLEHEGREPSVRELVELSAKHRYP